MFNVQHILTYYVPVTVSFITFLKAQCHLLCLICLRTFYLISMFSIQAVYPLYAT